MAAIQRWRRLGRVIAPGGDRLWAASHASYPTPLVRPDGTVRVFHSPRDAEGRSSITFLDLRVSPEGFSVERPPAEPILTHGPRGAFDDSGATVGSVVEDGGRLRLYYLGWSLGVTVPFRNFIGLAEGDAEGGPLERVSPAPILDRSEEDPFTLGYPWVLRDGAGWRMWYGSHLEWGAVGLEMRHVIKAARSADGIAWRRDGRPVLPLHGTPEFAHSRPCVVRDADRWRMWYSRRAPDYSLGYAESTDGEVWTRADDALAFTGPPGDWERESVSYATVFDAGGHRFMLYNGDGYGRTGFGLAVLERDAATDGTTR